MACHVNKKSILTGVFTLCLHMYMFSLVNFLQGKVSVCVGKCLLTLLVLTRSLIKTEMISMFLFGTDNSF